MTSEAHRRIEVMGTFADVSVRGADAELAVAAACVQLWDLEQRWSRFIAESEISAVNAAAGRPARVSPVTVMLAELAVAGHAITGGAFDPTVLGDLERAGYDRTFHAITRGSAAAAHSARVRGATGIKINTRAGTVELPRGVGLDPGGIGKGLAADFVIEALVAAGAAGARVNIGGDARVAGTPTVDHWDFAIEHPDGSSATQVRIGEGAIATSSTAIRRWCRDDQPCHHVIDPRCGRPVETDIASVSVIAARGWQAEVLTKAVLVLGSVDGRALVDALGAAVLVVGTDGTVWANRDWTRFAVSGETRRRSRS